MRRPLALMATLLMLSPAARAAVSAQLSASAIAPGDSVQLTLEHTGQGGGEPDLAPLNQDFDVLASSSSSRMEIDNGVVSSSTDVTLTLSPKHAGRLTIPSLQWGNDRSPALSLLVSASAAAAAPGISGHAAGGAGSSAGSSAATGTGASTSTPHEFLESSLDTQRPLVQAAVHLTVRLYATETIYHPNLTFSGGPDVLVQQVGDDTQSSEQRGGVTYRVVTRHYLLFPQRSGTLTLAGPVLDAQVTDRSASNPFANDPFGSFFGGALAGLVTTRPIRLHGQPIVLSVRARPPAADAASYWLPARAVTVSSQWQPSALRVRAGDPVTVHLHLQASDLTAAQLPDLSALWQLPAGLRAYPDQAKLHDSADGNSVTGSRDQTIALIADQPGRFTVPALAVHWWDTRANAARITTLPARTLEILPAAGGAGAGRGSSAAPAAPVAPVAAAAAARPGHAPAPTEHNEWRWISGALAALWLATVTAWAWSRRGSGLRGSGLSRRAAGESMRSAIAASKPDAARARTALTRACRDADARAARQAVLAWAAARWPQTPPRGLAELSRLVDTTLADALRQLDRACYAGEPWNGEALLASLSSSAQPDAPGASRSAKRSGEALAPLYP
jgi:BatD DUF11 like domain